MTIIRAALFQVPAQSLIEHPEIMQAKSYESLGAYEDSDLYLKHAYLLKRLFTENVRCELTAPQKRGVAITAVVIACKWAKDQDPYLADVLELFNLGEVFELKRFRRMERVFLKGIQYRVHVEHEQLMAVSDEEIDHLF